MRGEIKALKLESKLNGSKKGCDLTDLVCANSERCVHQAKVSLKSAMGCHHALKKRQWPGMVSAQPERIWSTAANNKKFKNCKKRLQKVAKTWGKIRNSGIGEMAERMRPRCPRPADPFSPLRQVTKSLQKIKKTVTVRAQRPP